MTVRQTTRVPKHLHAWLADRAKANHRSLNAELISILTARQVADDCGGKPAKIAPSNIWDDPVSGTQERGQ